MTPKATIPEKWREWLRILNEMTEEEKGTGASQGLWPDWVSPLWVEVYDRITPLELVLWDIIGNWPPLEEVVRRTPIAERQARLAQRDYRTIRQEVEERLSPLTGEERGVIDLRFGLLDGRARTLKQVAREKGCSASTVWRIEQRALRKVRAARAD